ACKLALASLLEAYAGQTGLSQAWARIFFLYGPREHPKRLVSSVIRSLLRGERARCSHGQQIRDYLHVEDAAGALVALLESEVTGRAAGRPQCGMRATPCSSWDGPRQGVYYSGMKNAPPVAASKARRVGP